MEKQLPKNWIECTMNELAEITAGIGFPNHLQGNLNGEIPFYKVGDISQSILRNEIYLNNANNYISEEVRKELKGKLFPKGTLVFAKIGEALRLNRRAIISKPSLCDNNVMGIIPNHMEMYKLIYYYFCTLDLGDFSAGNSIPSIRKSSVLGIPFPLPPLAEQNRLVTKLDKLFTQLEIIKTSMANIPLLLKDFRQQVLTQAVTGKLTEEWRKGKELVNDYNDRIININKRKSNINLPKNWLDLSFDSVVNIKSNLVPPNDYLEYPLITPDVIQSETGTLLSKPLVSDIMPISAKHYFSKGDIVYSKIRPYLSKLIITDFDGLCSADMYPLSTDLNVKFLFYFMLSSEFLIHATTAGERSVLPKINQKGLNIIPIPTPSLKEQGEIVSRVESLFVKADAIEQQYKSLKDKIDNLPQALLHKAFKGELTEQLESDGDAKELLRQIQELKNKTTKSKRNQSPTYEN